MSYQYAISETPRRRLVPSLTEIGDYYCPLADLPSPTTEQTSLIPKGNWSQIFQQGYDPTLEEKLERVMSRSMIDGIRIAVWRPGKNVGKDEDCMEMFEQYIFNLLHHETLSEKMMGLRNSHGKNIYRSVTAFLENHPESSVAIWHAIKEQRQTDQFQDDDAEFHLELNNIEWNEDGSRVKEVETMPRASGLDENATDLHTSEDGESEDEDSHNDAVEDKDAEDDGIGDDTEDDDLDNANFGAEASGNRSAGYGDGESTHHTERQKTSARRGVTGRDLVTYGRKSFYNRQQMLTGKSTTANADTNDGDVDMEDVDESTMHDPENGIRPDKKIKKERRPFKLNNTPQTALTVSSSEEESDLDVKEGNWKGWGLVRMEEHATPEKMGEGVARVQESNILKNGTKRNGRK